jgi:capsule polysaccharide export protein KpsC/LpsZ
MLEYSGLNLWGICKATIASHLASLKIDFNNLSHKKEIQRIYGLAILGIRNLNYFFKRVKPDAVLIFQGGVFDSRCVVEIAKRFNINVIGIENSMIGGMILLDNLSGQIINRHFMAHLGSELLEIEQITDEDRENAFNFWKSHIKDKAVEHKTGGIDSVDEIMNALNLQPDNKILLLLGQVRTDASIVLDSHLFNDPVDMIEAVAIHVSKNTDVKLIIRLHPKELSGTSLNRVPYDRMTYKILKEKGIDRLQNVIIIEDSLFNTYTLMKIAHAGITINSQSGLEMCLLRKPVMVCGRAFYGNKGFTVDLGHPSALKPTIDYLIQDAVMNEDKHRLAMSFFYLFFRRNFFDHQLLIHEKSLFRIFCPGSNPDQF